MIYQYELPGFPNVIWSTLNIWQPFTCLGVSGIVSTLCVIELNGHLEVDHELEDICCLCFLVINFLNVFAFHGWRRIKNVSRLGLHAFNSTCIHVVIDLWFVRVGLTWENTFLCFIGRYTFDYKLVWAQKRLIWTHTKFARW